MISTIDTVWVLLGTALIFFMQAGFAMVETGFTRAKNAGNIIMKILMDFVFGSLGYWFLGFGLMYGTTSIANGFIGSLDFFITGNYASNVPTYTNVMFQTVFCAAAATIVSGAMAERTKFKAYLIFSVIMSTVIYPISGHWIWGGGWLAQLGFHDFAGSTAIHLVGGMSAMVGAAILGPRIGKYTKEGKARAIPGHSLTLGALGVFILWFGWFGFNSASAMGIVDKEILVSRIFMTTNIAGVSAAFAALMITWIKYKKPDVSMTLNGGLAGLVAITAGCGTVTVKGSAIIGLMAGIIVVLGIEFVDKVLKIDDPVGAVGVHCFGGAFGTLMVGFFSYYSPNSTFGDKAGLLYGGGFKFLGVQALGVVTVAAWTALTMFIVFTAIKKTVGLRVSTEEEIGGLDMFEHGLESCYADFMPIEASDKADTGKNELVSLPKNAISVDDAVPVQIRTPNEQFASDIKLTRVSIIIKQSKFEALKTALQQIGITGMTVTNVLGCGVQRGAAEYYRGTEVDINLLPKVQVDIVVCKVPVRLVIETAKKVLYTGHIGDGKIFVYDVENVVKIRTGEEGCDALQDVE